MIQDLSWIQVFIQFANNDFRYSLGCNLLTGLTAPAAILTAGRASLTLLCDVEICSRRREKPRLARLSTWCFQIRTRKITVSQMAGVAQWASGLNSRENKPRPCSRPYLEHISRSSGTGNKNNTQWQHFSRLHVNLRPYPQHITSHWRSLERRERYLCPEKSHRDGRPPPRRNSYKAT